MSQRSGEGNSRGSDVSDVIEGNSSGSDISGVMRMKFKRIRCLRG